MKIIEKDNVTTVVGRRLRMRLTGLKEGDACVDLDARRGRSWIHVLGSERDTIAIFERTRVRGPLLNTRKRSLVFPQKIGEIENSNGSVVVTLEGKTGSHEATQRLTLGENDNYVNVRTTINIKKPVRVASLGASYAFVPDGMLYSQYEPLDFCWIPTLRKTSEHVIADQIFRAPSVTYQAGKIMAAIVPDLDVLADNRKLPTALDARIENSGLDAPAFWYGFCPYTIDGHVFFKSSPSRFEPVKGEFTYGCDLIASASEPSGRALRRVHEHLWQKYGRPLLGSSEPQVLPYEDYARRAYANAFGPGRIWRGFKLDGRDVGGTLALTYAGPSPTRTMSDAGVKAALKFQWIIPRLHGLAVEKLITSTAANDIFERFLHHAPGTVPPWIMFQSWFNNLRSAYGIFANGEALDDDELRDRALKMKELALAAPGEEGLACSVCYCPDDGDPTWVQGTKAFEAVREYHLPDNAWTGWWMLRWYDELEADERLLKRAMQFGDAFIRFQLASGAIPAWVRVRPSGPVASSVLRESAETAAMGACLALLGRISGEERYLKAARRAADFLIERVFPENKWWDFETFFSCSKKDFGMRDAGTGIHCMNNLCIFWTAELMRELAEAKSNKKYLDYGLRALDLTLAWQQVWDAPYVSINTFGGFGVMNTDAEWNDARQSAFAGSLMAYYRLTGEPEYFERGVAALRASFTTMLLPEHKGVAPGNMGAYVEKDDGATNENYAHLGFDRRAQGYLMFDWGSGGSTCAAARTRRLYGDVFIDAKNERGFGINLCTVERVSAREDAVSIKVVSGVSQKRDLLIKIIGLRKRRFRLLLNGRARGEFDAGVLEKGVSVRV